MRLRWTSQADSASASNETPETLFSGATAMHTNPWAVGTSAFLNGAVVSVLLWMAIHSVPGSSRIPGQPQAVDLSDLAVSARLALQGGGGGGGGARDVIDPIMGRTPLTSKTPLAPPQIPLADHPLIAIEPAIAVPPDIRLPDNPSLPNIGVHTSTNVQLDSNGPGSYAGIGTGSHGGDGPGSGPGYGPGFDGGTNGGPYLPGVGGMTAPLPLFTPEAEFSDEARRNKYQGAVMISIIVDSHGAPQSPRVIRSLGMGLDEKAIEAVQRYRFKPGMKNGHPVPVRITVEVNFRLY
jgi:TonB family protein